MEVRDVWRFPGENVSQFAMRAARPGSAPAKARLLDQGVFLNLIVVPRKLDDFMAGLAQKSYFRSANGVFATRALIEVVRDENFHRASFTEELGAATSFFSPRVRSRKRNVACVVSNCV